MFKWLRTMSKTKDDRQFEVLDQRLIDIQGKLKTLRGKVDVQFDNLSRKVDIMSSNIERIEKEAADAAENVKLVKAAQDGLGEIITGLKNEIADLKNQIAQGQLDQARLDAAATMLEKADDDIDALVLPPAPQPEPAPEG